MSYASFKLPKEGSIFNPSLCLASSARNDVTCHERVKNQVSKTMLKKNFIETFRRLWTNWKWQLACLHDQNKWIFWRAGFYPANQNNLKSFQKALMSWKKAGPSKSHFCFNHVNRLNVNKFYKNMWNCVRFESCRRCWWSCVCWKIYVGYPG